MYQCKTISLSVMECSLHLRESKAPIIVICVLIRATCSEGLLFSSNLINDDDLKLAETRVL